MDIHSPPNLTNTKKNTLEQSFEISSKPVPRIILGMSVKKATTFANTIAIPSIFIVTTAAGAYYNAQ